MPCFVPYFHVYVVFHRVVEAATAAEAMTLVRADIVREARAHVDDLGQVFRLRVEEAEEWEYVDDTICPECDGEGCEACNGMGLRL